METKLYTLEIGEDDQLDFQIAKVDRPAIESNWMVFNDQARFRFKDTEKRIVQ